MNTYKQNIDIPRPRYLKDGPWQLRGLTALTVLFGKNGSGKSLLLRSWRDNNIETTHYVVPERTGSLTFRANMLANQSSASGRQGQTRQNWVNDYREQVIGRIQAYFLARGAIRGDQLPGDPADLEHLINQLLPDFEISITGSNPPYEIARDDQQGRVTDVNQLSSGEAQLLTISLDILTIGAIWDLEKNAERVILIDEPDAHIHPDLQARFADFLVNVGNTYNLQIIVATHSTTLLSALGQFGGEETGVIYIDRVTDVFESVPFTKTLKELSASLGGHVLMGSLFGVPMLLVEGDDDYRIWSQAPRHHVVNLAVIPCGGDEIKDYQRTLEKVFSSLRNGDDEKAGYALLDGDKELPQTNTHPQDHIEFIRLNCHEAENLFLTDEVLHKLDHTWDSAMDLIEEKSSLFGQKEPLLSNVREWDRRNHDIKPIIEELSRILDTKNLHWTVRVGKVIGMSRPTGLLEDYLGESVINNIWGENEPSEEQVEAENNTEP